MKAQPGILLVNMGGPDDLKGVKPFLTAILEDPFILGMPKLIRIPLNRLIVGIRIKKVVERYRLIGGGSPLGKWSDQFVEGIRREFSHSGSENIVVEHAFRYCPPTIEKALRSFKDRGIDNVVMFPLFPHYTRAMTGSIKALAEKECHKLGIRLREVPVWGQDGSLLALQKSYLDQAVRQTGRDARVLFVAHGIPMSDVNRGDDYPDQVKGTAAELGGSLPQGMEWSLAFSSRLGPVKWVGPYLEEELARMGKSPAPLIIMQLSFVFDCLETLYDLDIVAANLVKSYGIQAFHRVPSFNDDPRFVKVVSRLLDGFVNA